MNGIDKVVLFENSDGRLTLIIAKQHQELAIRTFDAPKTKDDKRIIVGQANLLASFLNVPLIEARF